MSSVETVTHRREIQHQGGFSSYGCCLSVKTLEKTEECIPQDERGRSDWGFLQALAHSLAAILLRMRRKLASRAGDAASDAPAHIVGPRRELDICLAASKTGAGERVRFSEAPKRLVCTADGLGNDAFESRLSLGAGKLTCPRPDIRTEDLSDA